MSVITDSEPAVEVDLSEAERDDQVAESDVAEADSVPQTRAKRQGRVSQYFSAWSPPLR